jgi:hypothetical protein
MKFYAPLTMSRARMRLPRRLHKLLTLRVESKSAALRLRQAAFGCIVRHETLVTCAPVHRALVA